MLTSVEERKMSILEDETTDEDTLVMSNVALAFRPESDQAARCDGSQGFTKLNIARVSLFFLVQSVY